MILFLVAEDHLCFWVDRQPWEQEWAQKDVVDIWARGEGGLDEAASHECIEESGPILEYILEVLLGSMWVEVTGKKDGTQAWDSSRMKGGSMSCEGRL